VIPFAAQALAALTRLARAALARFEESLLVRLVGSFLALALVTVLLVALTAFLRARAALREAILARLETVALVKEGELTLMVDDEQGDLRLIAGLPGLSAEAARLAGLPADGPATTEVRQRITQLLDSVRAHAVAMDELFLLSAVGGRVIASTDPRRLGEYRVGDLFFQRGLYGPFIQNVYPSPLTGRPTLTIATPVRAGGAVVAVLAGHLDLTRVDRIVADRTGLGETGEAYLVTQLSDFVSAERFGRPEARRGIHTDGVRAALDGHTGSGVYRNYLGVRVLGAWRWIHPRQLALMVEMHAEEAFAPARDLVTTILGIGLVFSLLLVGGVYLVARRVAQPILAVADAADKVARGQFDAVAPIVTRDEVGVLAGAFNSMTARLRTLYDDLHRQIEHTSRAYRALQEGQQLLQAVIDNTPNLVAVLDADGRLLLVNRCFEALFGLTNAEVRGRPPGGVLPGRAAAILEESSRAALTARRAVERDADLELRGATHHFQMVAFPLAEAGRAPFGVGLVGVDLTERSRVEAERRQLEAGVQQAQKLESLGLLAGGIAHDFNNILTAIVGGTSIALQELDALSPLRGDLEQVVTAAERAAKLTRQMLAYAGRASLAVETFDLNTVIREMAELIEVSVPKGVRLERDLTRGLPPIRGDRTQVSQIVLNLITNAAEATGERGGTVRMGTSVVPRTGLAPGAWRFAPSDAAEFVALTVEDDGCGMAAETLERMFDPFFSTKGSGRGLGLAAVLGIVRQSGGTLRVISAPDRGTAFTVLFPAAPVATPEAAAPPTAVPSPAGAGTVLVVDDEEAVRRVARRVLQRAGYAVLEARDGAEALSIFREKGAALSAVVLDVTMPVMTGTEAFAAMRELGPPVPTIFSSGYDQLDTVSHLEGEDIAFLQKPYRPEQLLRRINELVQHPGSRAR
jgi:PAS domain S-box-containing protein